MTKVESLNVLKGFAFKHNLLGGYAVMPSRIDKDVLRSNGELRAALLTLQEFLPNLNEKVEINKHIVSLLESRNGEKYIHWCIPSDDIPSYEEFEEAYTF